VIPFLTACNDIFSAPAAGAARRPDHLNAPLDAKSQSRYRSSLAKAMPADRIERPIVDRPADGECPSSADH
jgi:hypothetical protein